MGRRAEIERETRETKIRVLIDLDGEGKTAIATGIGFFDHLLDAFARHGRFDLTIEARGDLEVDEHHTVEDVGLCLGRAIAQAVGEKQGISRFGWALCPMDEALARVAVDLCGRAFSVYQNPIHPHRLGELHGSTIPEFFRAVASGGFVLHVDVIRGQSLHHAVEACFKAFGRALAQAVSPWGDPHFLPTTKGYLA